MIDKLMRARTLVGVSAVLLLASGVAVAATDTGPRPAVSQEETTTSSTSVDPSSTTSTSVDDNSTTSTTEDTTSTTVAPTTSTTAPGANPNAEHHDNHGACVSQAAHETEPGPDHGKTVSSVAQSDCGKTTATTEANENENEPAEHENEPAEPTEQQHGSNSGPGSSNSGHGSDHGGHGSD